MRLTITARTSDRTSAWALVLRHVSLWITLILLLAVTWRAGTSTASDPSEPPASASSMAVRRSDNGWRTAGRSVGRVCRAVLPTELDAVPCDVPAMLWTEEAP